MSSYLEVLEVSPQGFMQRFLKYSLCLLFLFFFLTSLNFLEKKTILFPEEASGVNDKKLWCKKLRFLHPKDGVAALASFPGSGNTWLRYLLQQATGIFTGSVYSDYDLLTTSFPAEGIHNASVLVVKTHERGSQVWAMFSRGILLVRDPEKAILSEFHRQHAGHMGVAPKEVFFQQKGLWEQFVKENLNAWSEFNLDWKKNFSKPLKIVFYDDLVENLRESLEDILIFLDFPIERKAITCAVRKQKGIFKRKIESFDPYSRKMKIAIEDVKKRVFAELNLSKS